MDKKGNTLIYILLAVGFLLITAGSSLKNTGKTLTENEVVSENPEVSLESRLESILSKIKGAGKVSVMITTEDGGEKTFGYDGSGKEKSIVILNRSGGDEALVSKENPPSIRGIIIVAEGGGDSKVKEKLINAAKTVLGIAPHKIEVFERNG